MRNGTIKSAAVVGIAVVAAALWGAGYWQGGRSARSLTTDAASVGVERTAAISSVERETQEAQEKRKTSETPETPILPVARDLPIEENDAIPALDGRCEARLETSATEIPLGDAVYCRFVERNVAEDGTPIMLMDYNAPFFAEEMGQSANFLYRTVEEIALETPKIDGKYIFAPELESGYSDIMGFPPQIALAPGEEYEYGTLAVEFPSLEDWNEPFWRGVRELLATEERVEFRMRVAFSRRLGTGGEPTPFGAGPHLKTEWTDSTGVFEKKIVLTRRPETETKRFDEWFASTPAALWPERKERMGPSGKGTFKIPPKFTQKASVWERPEIDEYWTRRLRASGQSNVALDSLRQTFDVWKFVRFGNRKPSDPNNPTTLDGWRALEAEFSPSTVKDEITLTRLQLEYYDAEDGEGTSAALGRLLAWLDALDPTRRAAYKNAILAKAWMLNPRFGGGMSGTAPYTLAETGRDGGASRGAANGANVEIARKWVRLSEALGRAD